MREMIRKIYEKGTVEIIISTPVCDFMDYVTVLNIEERDNEFGINGEFTFKKEGAIITDDYVKWVLDNGFVQISIVY